MWAKAKKAHGEKKPHIKEAHKAKTPPQKSYRSRPAYEIFFLNMKNILFFKIYY